jgi:hypothetical protein
MQYYRSHGDFAAGVGPNGVLALPTTFNVSESVRVSPDPRLVPPATDEAGDVDAVSAEEPASTSTP